MKKVIVLLVFVLVFGSVAVTIAAPTEAPLRGYTSFWNSWKFSTDAAYPCGPWYVLSGDDVYLQSRACDETHAQRRYFYNQDWASIRHDFPSYARLWVTEGDFLKCYIQRTGENETVNTCRWRIYTEASGYTQYVQPLCEISTATNNCPVVVPEDGKVYDVRLGWRYMDYGVGDYEVKQIQFYHWDVDGQ
jgi:hypothetical protein